MQEKVMNAFADQAKSMYEPLRKINALMVSNMEKMTEFQLETLKSYSEMGIGQLKQATEIKDAETAREYTAGQAELMGAISKKVIEDVKAMTDMTMEFRQEVEKVFEEVRGNMAQAAKSDKRPAAGGKTAA